MASMKDVARISWSIFWKTTLAGFIGGFVLGSVFGFIVGFISTVAGIPRNSWEPISSWGGAALGLAASFVALNFFLASAIGKTIGQKRLELYNASTTSGGT